VSASHCQSWWQAAPHSTKYLIGAEGQFRTGGLRRNDAVIEYDATTEHGHYDG
jgi:hypothetical protein